MDIKITETTMDIKETDKEIKARAIALGKYEDVGFWFYNGLVGVKKDRRWGFINDEGQLVIPCQFLDKPIFEGDYARAYIERHCCGLIDIKGTIIIPFEYDNVKPFDEEGFAQFEKGIYWGTIDRNGNKHISPKMKFQQIGNFTNGIAPAKIDTKWGLIDTKGNKITPFQYYEIENCCNGLFYSRLKPRLYGYLKPDGEPLFQNWFERMDKFGDKSLAIFRENGKYGIAHINGSFLLPAIYDELIWDGNKKYLNVSLNGKVQQLSPSDLISSGHINEEPNVDVEFLERLINWVLPGLTFYYRDTNFPVNVDEVYKKGDIIRAGAFMDVTHKAQKPVSKIRFIVASSHVAKLCEIEDLCRQSPIMAKCRLSTLHFNSCFKIMDIYKVGEQYQIFLLHIPYKGINFFENNTSFIFQAGGTSESTLVEMARQSFDTKMHLEPLRTLDEPEWIERTYIPMGTDEKGNLMSLDYAYSDNDDVIALSDLIRKLADDTDEINTV